MRTMGFQRRATLHLDLAASAEDDDSRPSASPKTIQNDLPHVEPRVEEKKTRKEDGIPAKKSSLRREEAAVELAIEKLPEN